MFAFLGLEYLVLSKKMMRHRYPTYFSTNKFPSSAGFYQGILWCFWILDTQNGGITGIEQWLTHITLSGNGSRASNYRHFYREMND